MCTHRGPFRIIRLIRQLVVDPLNPVVTSCIFVEEPISDVLRKHTKIQWDKDISADIRFECGTLYINSNTDADFFLKL